MGPDPFAELRHLSPHTRALVALDRLGATAEAVARALYRLDFRGIARCPWFCPVSRYLCAVLRDPEGVPPRVQVYGTRLWIDGGTSLPVPRPVAELVRRLDRGEFLFLSLEHHGAPGPDGPAPTGAGPDGGPQSAIPTAAEELTQ